MAAVAASDKENMPASGPKAKALGSGELKMMLGQCLKMASENKITASNTWGLPLIEHLDDLIKGENPGQHTNFQRASVTLDAGVKIYSYRVDSVHTELFKMLGGLGRASGPQDDQEEGELGDGGVGNASPSKRKRKNGDLNPDATLEPTLEALNIKKFDLAFAVDPLFHKTSAQFDEGGAKGLLLNNLSVFRGCDIVFDSMDVPEAAVDDAAATAAASAACISLDGLKPQLQALTHMRGDERISPAIDNILELLGAAPAQGAAAQADRFVQCIAESAAGNTAQQDLLVAASAPGSPAEMQGIEGSGATQEGGAALEVPAAYAVDDDDYGNGGGGGFDDGGYDDYSEGEGGLEDSGALGHHNAGDDGNGVSRMGRPSGGNGNGHNLNEDAINWLISAGTSAATASYVTASKGWAGASHWRYRAVPQGAGADGGEGGDQEVDQVLGGKKKRGAGAARKKNEPLDFVALMAAAAAGGGGAGEPEFEMLPKGNTKRGKAKSKPKAKNLLPEDHHYNAEFLGRYSLRPRSFVALPGAGNGGGGLGNGAGDGYVAGQDCGFGDFGGFNGGDDHDDDAGDSYGGEWGAGMDFGGGEGDGAPTHVGDALELVDAARKVEKVDVNYSRAAKQVDVRCLKELMWGGIHEVLEKREAAGEDRDAPIEFAEVLATVPAMNAAGRLEDLSVHLCFICVLHLANEHGLVVRGVPGLDRLEVSNVPVAA